MEDLKISKELLIEVLGSEYNQRLVDWFQIEEDNFLRTYYDCGSYDDKGRPTGLGLEINIYEFAFKCKKWAWENFKIMLISHYTGQCYINGDLSDLELNYWNKTKSYQIEDNTEVKAIIKACEWILKETGN